MKTQVNPRAVKSALCRKSYVDFVRTFWDVVVKEPLKWNWHMDLGCQEVQECYERVFRRQPYDHYTVTNQPPGTSKSIIHSVMTVPWAWTNMPEMRFLGASYSDEVAQKLSMFARDIIKSDLYKLLFPEIKLREDMDRLGNFMNMLGGERFSVGIKGTVTGTFHGHVICIDDALSPEQSNSNAETARVNHWMVNTVLNRKVDKDTTYVDFVGQRLRKGDATDKFLEVSPRVKHIRLPAEDTYPISPPELKDKYVDGLLDKERLGRQAIDEEKKKGELYYAAQFGQCLVAGTMVLTHCGLVPIESVTTGHKVWTRRGWSRVMWSGTTRRESRICSLVFVGGGGISGSLDHPIWTEGRGFASMESVSGGDLCRVLTEESKWPVQCQDRPKLCGSRVESIYVDQGNATSEIARPVATDFTEMSGDITEVRSPLARMYTTRTTTHLTIELEILSASPSKNMVYDMPTVAKSVKTFLRRFVRSVLPGESRKRAESSIRKMVESVWQQFVSSGKAVVMFAKPVERILRRTTARSLNTALGSARSDIGFVVTKGSVSGAKSNSSLPTHVPAPVLSDVELSCGDPVALHDLVVEQNHEFFADGILVHNSPKPLGGGKFKTDMLRVGIPPTQFVSIVRSWDKAATVSTSKLADPAYSVGTLVAKDIHKRIWILDVVRVRVDSFERERLIKRTARRDTRAVEIEIEQEPGSGGKDSAVGTVRRLMGYRVHVTKPTGNKEIRAEEFSVQVNAGNVWLPIQMKVGDLWVGWAAAFVDELDYWPFSDFMDQVDSASAGFNRLWQGKIRVGPLEDIPQDPDGFDEIVVSPDGVEGLITVDAVRHIG